MNSEQTEEKHKKQKTTGMVSFKSKALKYLQSKKIPKTPKKQLLILNPNDTISSTLKKFKQHDVRSAPMKHSQDHLFEFVDFRDLNAFLMDKFLEVDKTKSVKSSVLLDKTLFQKFMNTPLEQVANYCEKGSFGILEHDISLWDAAKQLKSKKRLLIKNEKDDISQIITPSDVIFSLEEIINKKPTEDTLETLKMSHQVQCVNENFRAIDVFAFLRERQVSFAPVVDMKNKLISVVSLRDLRILVDQKDFSILDLPIIDFIGVVRQNDIPETKFPYIWCEKSNTLDTIIKRLKATRVHRLIIIDEHKHVTGCVTIKDIIKFLTN